MGSDYIFDNTLVFIPVSLAILVASELIWIYQKYWVVKRVARLTEYKWYIYITCLVLFLAAAITTISLYSLEFENIIPNINSMDNAGRQFIDKLEMDCGCFNLDLSKIDNGYLAEIISFTKNAVISLYPVVITITVLGLAAIVAITAVEMASTKYSAHGKLIMMAFTLVYVIIGSSLVASAVLSDGFNYVSKMAKGNNDKLSKILTGQLPCTPLEFINPDGIPILIGTSNCSNRCYYPNTDVINSLVNFGGYGAQYLYNSSYDTVPCVMNSTISLVENVDACPTSPQWAKCVLDCVGIGNYGKTLEVVLCEFANTTKRLINDDFKNYQTKTQAFDYTIVTMCVLLIFGTIGSNNVVDTGYEKGESIMMDDYGA
jgi:hypothetical protein